MDTKKKKEKRIRRHRRVRVRIKGTTERPRLCVFRSAKSIYVQLIDDSKGTTLLSTKSTAKIDAASKLGENIAKKALEKGVKEVVFDRAGYAYEGQVKALAEGARKGGLKF